MKEIQTGSPTSNQRLQFFPEIYKIVWRKTADSTAETMQIVFSQKTERRHSVRTKIIYKKKKNARKISKIIYLF